VGLTSISSSGEEMELNRQQAEKLLENIALIRAGRKPGFKVSGETLSQWEKLAQKYSQGGNYDYGSSGELWTGHGGRRGRDLCGHISGHR